ncbi:ATP-dependent zinc metalloprotease FtsH [Croceimicrobium hydrocarbonivorans]|uniref:ATP-dependent zinc metalloprotease FtsH n=1 Tax=Croceimicrobium hydrocarbonivorans TaxID=2761580 RepID=A0A7H0VGT9_9FLAO|nr:ATP-dependent zinc metalloprotease FtsH [Croceimicrobium hydrocarbonivorans]QNR24937.1 ATP-dependent metallopeptidase FtsH/Yme1/Tma family protein [Croceimicrobium hydrocarbonivorans]
MENEKDNKEQLRKLKEQFSRNSGEKPNGNNKGGPGGDPRRRFNIYWIYAIIALFLIALQLLHSVGSDQKQINFDDFTAMIERGDVNKVKIINEKIVQVYLTKDALDSGLEEYKGLKDNPMGPGVDGPHFSFEMPYEAYKENMSYFYEQHPELKGKRITPHFEEVKDYFGGTLSYLIPFILLIGIWIFIMRRMSGGGGGPGAQIFNIGKSKAQLFDQNTNVKITFKNVAGLEGAKEEVQEIVSFLKDPDRYTSLGGKIPKGALLVGPPGTGKTLLAKAVAGEAKVPFFSLSGSDFVEMFVGVGASRVRDLFKQAKEKSPSIIFIDEIDAIGRARGKNALSGGNDERENTLNQLLTEMDGFGTNEHVIVLAATNRADILDKALLRAGRFDRQIFVDLPELNERKEIFKVHLAPLKLAPKVDSDFLARQTPGFSGADIANVCNEAALIAARKDKKAIDQQDFLDAVDRIIGGLEKKSKIISHEEKKIIAHHEAGHATVSWLLEHAHPLVKVTIVPRGRSLGAAWYLPEERQLTNTDQILDEMCAALGGRAAEEIIFGKISTGALSDLEKVTKQARAMVTIYGLNAKLGNITYYDSQNGNEMGFTKPYSERTAQIIDEEISKIIENQYLRAKELLTDNQEKLIELAELLLEKEVIFKENLEEIFGKRRWKSRDEVLHEENHPEEELNKDPEASTEEAESTDLPA